MGEPEDGSACLEESRGPIVRCQNVRRVTRHTPKERGSANHQPAHLLEDLATRYETRLTRSLRHSCTNGRGICRKLLTNNERICQGLRVYASDSNNSWQAAPSSRIISVDPAAPIRMERKMPDSIVRDEYTINQDAIQSLAEETRHPVPIVTQVYEAEFARLKADARVTEFLVLFASRRAREALRSAKS